MTDKTKTVVKKIVEIVVYLLVGAVAIVINFDKINNAFKDSESHKVEQSAQMYATDTVNAVTEKAETVTK